MKVVVDDRGAKFMFHSLPFLQLNEKESPNFRGRH
jgi:hypothetical protein